MKKTLFLFVISFLGFVLHAQTPTSIKGTVKDALTGEELLGVSVLVVGTNTGVASGINGDFTISAPVNSTLKVSYVGYLTQQIKLTGQSTLDIKLAQDTKVIDEVVVVGYTVQKKRDVLGAISKVNNEELNKLPQASAQQALQGRVAGVNVTSANGSPGSPVSVRIRGTNSILLSNEPLYVVDGVPVEGALNNLSPTEIESMTVLKDASSAAVYGSRASNGIVLITTKNGKSGAAKVSYNMQIGVQSHGHLTPMATTDQYIQLYNEAATADNANSVVQRPLIEGSWVKDFSNTNHLASIFRTAPLQSHEISISGGSEKTQYMITGNIFKQDGIVKGTNYDRYSLRSNINSEVKKWLRVGLSVAGSLSNNRLVSSSGDGYAGEGGSVIRYALYRNPAIPIYNDKGDFVDLPSEYYGNSVYNSFFGDGYSPEGLCENTDRVKKQKSLLVTGNFIITLPANFFLKTVAGIDYTNTGNREWNGTWGTADRINSTNSLYVSNSNLSSWTVNTVLNHSITFNEIHNITSMIGAEAVRRDYNFLSATESGFINSDPKFQYLGFGSSLKSSYQDLWSDRLLSFFGNVNYNYNQKYYLSAIIRRDGSSHFAKGNNWGTFYSFSGGWNVETEEFMKNQHTISKMKVRVGYGAVGNQSIPPYSYLDRMGNNYYYTFGGNVQNGYAQNALGNIDLKWETSKQFNTGVDFEFLKGDLGVTIDYFYKTTKNMLLPSSIPPSVGDASAPIINTNGSVLNTGIDIETFFRKNYRNGGFNIALNVGYLKNKVLSLDGAYFAGRVDNGVNVCKTEVGYPLGSFFVYQMDGIFQNQTEVLTSAYQGKNVQPGDVKYVDVFKDNVIDSKDRVHMGSAIPTFTTGLTLSGNYKDFDVSTFFQGAFGQKIFSQVNFDIEGFYRGFNVTERYFNEHWTGEGTSNTQPRASWGAKSNNVRASSRFLEDGSYLRMKNVQIGYTIPKTTTQRLKIETVRVYVGATNLLTFTSYSGIDPEMTVSTNSASEGDIANGIDWGTYPIAKNITFGLNITF